MKTRCKSCSNTSYSQTLTSVSNFGLEAGVDTLWSAATRKRVICELNKMNRFFIIIPFNKSESGTGALTRLSSGTFRAPLRSQRRGVLSVPHFAPTATQSVISSVTIEENICWRWGPCRGWPAAHSQPANK